jgi:hypothetical protein
MCGYHKTKKEEHETYAFCNAQRSFVLASAALLSTAAHAQSYPSKAVRMIVPFAPGGGTDIQARLLSKKFQESTSQTFIVDNRPTGNGMLGAELAAKSPPDGYTILFMSAALAVNTTLVRKLEFDPLKDLEGVSLVSSVPLVLVVHPSLPVRDVRDLAALSKKSKTGLKQERKRDDEPPFARDVQADDRCERHAHTLQRLGACRDCAFVGRVRVQLSHRARSDAAHQGRQAPRARRDHREESECAARPSPWLRYIPDSTLITGTACSFPRARQKTSLPG